MDRRDLLRAGAASLAGLSGCSIFLDEGYKTAAEGGEDADRASFGADIDNKTDITDVKVAEEIEEAEDLVGDIQRLEQMMDQGKDAPYKTQIYLGGINQHGTLPSLDFTLEDDDVIDRFRDAEDGRIMNELRSHDILQLSGHDRPEIPLILDNQIEVEVVYLQYRTELEDMVQESAEYLSWHLQGFTSENYSVDVSTEVVPAVTDDSVNLETEADRVASEMRDSSLKLFLTERDLDVDGFTNKATDKAFVKIEQAHALNREDFLETFIHEPYHNLFDLPHTGYENYLLSLEGESMEVSSRNAHLARRYMSAEPEVSAEIYEHGNEEVMGVEVDFRPTYMISSRQNREDVFEHFEKYIKQQEHFPIQNWQRESYDPENLEMVYSRKAADGKVNLSFSIDDERYFRNASMKEA